MLKSVCRKTNYYRYKIKVNQHKHVSMKSERGTLGSGISTAKVVTAVVISTAARVQVNDGIG